MVMNRPLALYTEPLLVSETLTPTGGDGAGVYLLGMLSPGPFRGFALRVDRESSTSGGTLDVKLQTVDETTGDVTDWLDSGGSNNLLLPQWGSGSNVVKWMKVHPNALSSDADNVLIVNTANRVYNEVWWAPIYVAITCATQNSVVSASFTYLP